MISFKFTPEQQAKYMDWHKEKCVMYGRGSIGGRLTFEFAPTSLGVVVNVKCACGQKIDLSEYENW